MSEPNADSGAAVPCISLFAALNVLELKWSRFHRPDGSTEDDETIQWALNELSDEAHAHILGPVNDVLSAYREFKKVNNGRTFDAPTKEPR